MNPRIHFAVTETYTPTSITFGQVETKEKENRTTETIDSLSPTSIILIVLLSIFTVTLFILLLRKKLWVQEYW